MKTHLPEKLMALALIVLLAASCSAMPESIPLTPTPRGIESVTLEVQQDFTEVSTEISLPVKEAIQRTLERVNVLVVEPGQTADAALKFQLTFIPLKEEIDLGIGTAICWNGAEVTGEMTLTETGKEPRQFPLKHTNPPINLFVMLCSTAEEAPFGEVWAPAVLEPLSQVWDHAMLLKAFEDDDPSIRVSTLELLDKHQPEPPEAVPTMIKALEDPHESVISTAAFILGERKEISAVPALIIAIQRTDEAGRNASTATIYALHLIGPEARDAVPALIALLGDESEVTVNSAASALKAITGQDFGTDASGWQAWWDQQ